MARLPQPGADSGEWGTILNDYLSQAHAADGTLKPGSVTNTTIAADAVNATSIADGTISEALLDSNVQNKLNATPAAQAAMRPLSASYRPLKGVTSAITSTITSGEAASGTFYQWDNASGHYRFVGCNPVAFSDPTLCANLNVGLDSALVANTIEVEFWSNATTIRAYFFNQNRHDVWAVVDDRRIADGTYQHANVGDGMCTWELTQSSPVWRKWRLGIPATTFRGMGINSGARMVPTSKGYQLAVIGDSYVQGALPITNAVAPGTTGVISSGMVFGEFAQETGLDVWRAGVAGSGYINDAGHGANGHYGSAARMNAFADVPAMDAIVVWGTANDKPYAPADVVAAAKAVWAQLRSARPNTPLIVVGPECTGWPDGPLDTLNNALKAAANDDANVTAYVDLRNNNFMNGTGYEGSEQNDGNADVFISADSSHPTHPGNRYWGQNIARLLGTVLVPADQANGSY